MVSTSCIPRVEWDCTNIWICNIGRSTQKVENGLGDVPCNLLACLFRQLAAVEDAKVADARVIHAGGIGLKPATALAPGADTGGINMSPVSLAGVCVHPIYGSSHRGGVLSGKAPRRISCRGGFGRRRHISFWVNISWPSGYHQRTMRGDLAEKASERKAD